MLPREKYILKGIDNLSDLDLIQILIGSGNKKHSYISLSKKVLKILQDRLGKSKDIDIKDLKQINGVGNVISMRILCGIELGKRLYTIPDNSKTIIKNSEDAYIHFKDMCTLKKERVDCIFLNSRFELISKDTIAMGSLNCANLLPRDILVPALAYNSAFVVICHNHPSGDSTPSNEDIQFTKTLVNIFDIVGLQLLDHIVVSKYNWNCIALE